MTLKCCSKICISFKCTRKKKNLTPKNIRKPKNVDKKGRIIGRKCFSHWGSQGVIIQLKGTLILINNWKRKGNTFQACIRTKKNYKLIIHLHVTHTGLNPRQFLWRGVGVSAAETEIFRPSVHSFKPPMGMATWKRYVSIWTNHYFIP